MERIWGGRALESLLGKNLPDASPIGELWELVDRPEAQSIVQKGRFRGKTLHQLWSEHRAEVFGERHARHPAGRFPILFKLLDARERLSVQVHPPEHRANPPFSEPKTECWYFLHADKDAEVYAGLKRGVSREDFSRALNEGTLEETLHRVPVCVGESFFLPSGRLHAIGSGLVIVEVQQNSDTTFRVFDWNRTGTDGKKRELHVNESLESIDFGDIEPGATPSTERQIADCPYFHVEKRTFSSSWNAALPDDFLVMTCVEGKLRCATSELLPGGFLLIPATAGKILVEPLTPSVSVLATRLPSLT
jgi:mannose-6-phosphate isomerase